MSSSATTCCGLVGFFGVSLYCYILSCYDNNCSPPLLEGGERREGEAFLPSFLPSFFSPFFLFTPEHYANGENCSLFWTEGGEGDQGFSSEVLQKNVSSGYYFFYQTCTQSSVGSYFFPKKNLILCSMLSVLLFPSPYFASQKKWDIWSKTSSKRRRKKPVGKRRRRRRTRRRNGEVVGMQMEVGVGGRSGKKKVLGLPLPLPLSLPLLLHVFLRRGQKRRRRRQNHSWAQVM